MLRFYARQLGARCARCAAAGPGDPQRHVPRLVDVKTSRQWILYSLLRVGIFAAALTALLLAGIEPWIAALVAAVIGLCITYIFFRPQRDAVARNLWERRNAPARDDDAAAEDGADEAVTGLEGHRGGESDAEEQGRQAR